MAIRKVKPITNGLRHMTYLDNKKNLTGHKSHKPLVVRIAKHSGRNNHGKITIRHRGGGHKPKYRIIDFKRNKDNIPGTISTIEYDPNRTANISLVTYADGEKRYILTPKGVKVGDKILSGEKVEIKAGNCTALKNIPDGTFIHNIEMNPGQGGKLIRSAGTTAQLLGKDEKGKYAIIKLRSKEMRKILASCRATIGIIANEEHSLINWGKAGRNRHRGIRPTVRGSAMNPNDHPHGGGEGKQPIGRKSPMTPWGKKAFGVKTRRKKKSSTKLIIKKRQGGR